MIEDVAGRSTSLYHICLQAQRLVFLHDRSCIKRVYRIKISLVSTDDIIRIFVAVHMVIAEFARKEVKSVIAGFGCRVTDSVKTAVGTSIFDFRLDFTTRAYLHVEVARETAVAVHIDCFAGKHQYGTIKTYIAYVIQSKLLRAGEKFLECRIAIFVNIEFGQVACLTVEVIDIVAQLRAHGRTVIEQMYVHSRGVTHNVGIGECLSALDTSVLFRNLIFVYVIRVELNAPQLPPVGNILGEINRLDRSRNGRESHRETRHA